MRQGGTLDTKEKELHGTSLQGELGEAQKKDGLVARLGDEFSFSVPD